MEIQYILDKKIKVSEDTLKYFGSFLWDRPTSPDALIAFYDLIKDKTNPIVLDVGACTGSFTLLPVLKKDIQMYAFEPTRSFFELEKNIKLNEVDAHIYNVAVSDYDGEGLFHELTDDLPIALSMLGGKPANHKANILDRQVTVISIDKFCKDNNLKPNAIKIDVEGNELFVLKGALKILNESHPIVFCEYSQENCNQYNYARTDIYNLLIEAGYTVSINSNDIVAIWGK